ncbi:MAG TPA: metallophosphoesterase [Saprospiraceae bacterium]|nr:metallophosphoesterase [Saprospiraceae bacterium]
MASRIIFLSVILLLIDLFAFQAFRYVMGSSGRITRIVTYAIYWSIPVITIAFLVAALTGWSDNLPKTLKVVLRAMIFILYFSKLLVALMILIDDLRRLIFGALNLGFKDHWNLSTARSRWMPMAALILGAIPAISLSYGMALNPYRYKLWKNRLNIKDLHPDLAGFKIIQISDIHSGSFLLREPVEQSIKMINDQKPDIVFFTGDLVNALASEMEPFVEMFSKIQAPYGVYSILGNHDYGDYHPWPNEDDKHQNFEDLKGMHAKLGWTLLLNEHRQISVKDALLNIIGVENYSSHPRFPKYGDLTKATTGLNGGSFNVLLSHDPSHWDDQVIRDFKHIELTLSGHTHGFQFGVEIPGFKWSPIQYVYPRWSGLYQEAAQYLYVNRGLGYLGYPGRVGILPEITFLTLETA